MNFKKILAEGLDDISSGLQNMGQSQKSTSLYEIRVNGKTILTANSKEELIQQINNIP
jgi:hypothetical protein